MDNRLHSLKAVATALIVTCPNSGAVSSLNLAPRSLGLFFGSVNGIPADVERGWIRLSEAAHLFSPEEPNYAFGIWMTRGSAGLPSSGRIADANFNSCPPEGVCIFDGAWIFQLERGRPKQT